jgi:hypothetical protein
LGSTLRSMEEVLSNKSTAATGLIVFIQVSNYFTLHKLSFFPISGPSLPS